VSAKAEVALLSAASRISVGLAVMPSVADDAPRLGSSPIVLGAWIVRIAVVAAALACRGTEVGAVTAREALEEPLVRRTSAVGAVRLRVDVEAAAEACSATVVEAVRPRLVVVAPCAAARGTWVAAVIASDEEETPIAGSSGTCDDPGMVKWSVAVEVAVLAPRGT
jgi:hypothetical protein